MYDNVDYARSRLLETVIRDDKGKLIYVNNIAIDSKELIVDCNNLLTKNRKQLPLELCNLKPLPLGNIQYGNKCSYVSRIPMRRDWRQGTRPQNIIALDGNLLLRSLFDLGESLQNCVDNNYMNFEEAIDKSSDYRTIAFAKKFSLTYKNDAIVYLFYKHKFVGSFDKTFKTIMLEDNYNYLQEQIEREINA